MAFKVGDKVLVTDQRPPAEGKVVEVSTWHEVIGPPAKGSAYKVECDTWHGGGRWIGPIHLEARS